MESVTDQGHPLHDCEHEGRFPAIMSFWPGLRNLNMCIVSPEEANMLSVYDDSASLGVCMNLCRKNEPLCCHIPRSMISEFLC